MKKIFLIGFAITILLLAFAVTHRTENVLAAPTALCAPNDPVYWVTTCNDAAGDSCTEIEQADGGPNGKVCGAKVYMDAGSYIWNATGYRACWSRDGDYIANGYTFSTITSPGIFSIGQVAFNQQCSPYYEPDKVQIKFLAP